MSDTNTATGTLPTETVETRVQEGMDVDTSDGPWGEVADIIIDPVRRRLTHLVVQPHGRHDQARLVPINAVRSCDDRVQLSWTAARMLAEPVTQETSFMSLGNWPEPAEGWDVGVTDSVPWVPNPLFNATGFGYLIGDEPYATTTFDRVPQGTAELRRASDVVASDGHVVGHVDGFVVDRHHNITHLVLEHGHLWGHREITIPVGDIETVTSDRVHLRVMRDAVGAFPSVPVHRHHGEHTGAANVGSSSTTPKEYPR